MKRYLWEIRRISIRARAWCSKDWRAMRLDDAGFKGICLFLILIVVSVSSGLAFDITPTSPTPGQEITISGTAKPGEALTFESSFAMNLPVSGGQYEYETTIQVPQKPNRFTVSARNVQDLNAGVKIVIWITKGFQASGGTVRLSQADVPPGRYNLKMFGSALPGSIAVPVDIKAETQVLADSNGKYELTIDTTGIPAGSYRIRGASETKTVCLGGSCTDTSSASQNVLAGSDTESNEIDVSVSDTFGGSNADGRTTKTKKSNAVGINRETVKWYAGQVGLSAENSSQYDEAEELLRKRLDGGYWKIIARGEPLTEEAGDCMQEYCLVRGNDACTICRDKDIILKGGGKVVTATHSTSNNSNSTAIIHISSDQNSSNLSQPESDQDKGIVSKITDWLFGWLGMFFGRQ
ncbi:MAG: hypothetical protein LUQ59_01270 [Methanothrix sp.]|nr:hypothetical protein [Methanothrix sp.]